VAERVLTIRELNRATLARQLLLRRSRLSVPRAIERLAGLQAQWPPSPYVALWSRLEGFERERLMRALLRRQVVKAPAMRITLHLLSADDYVLFAGALKAPWTAQLSRRMERMGIDVDIPALAEEALALMADGPRSRSEVLEVFGSGGHEQPWFIWTLVQAELGLVRAPESALWRETTGPVSYVPAQSWLGRSPDAGATALVHLVRRYLAAFGPASRADLGQWSGLPVSTLAPAVDSLEPLRRYRDEVGRELLDLPRRPLPGAETPAPVRFLPRWDSTLLAYDNRERILPEAYRKTVIRNGDVLSTFLVDGFVAGAWRAQKGRVALDPFAPIPRRVHRELNDEVRALEAFLR
jgi:hypothetical protein